MKISLVNPPQIQLKEPLGYVPLGLAYLASSLIKEGFEPFNDVRIDNLAGLEIDKNVNLDYADIYCITYMSAARDGVKKICDYLKNRYQESRVILGGPHPSVDTYNVFDDVGGDTIITGEAENFIPNYLKDFGNDSKIRGIFHDGIIENLDSLPFPARRLFNYDNVVNMSGLHGCEKGVRSTTLITSRGCPYNCRFCCKGHQMYSRYRCRSAENVRDELIELRRHYGIEHVRFVDDCFTLDNNRTKKICEYTKELEITSMIIARADTCNFDVLKTLKRGGCKMINIGVESGSDKLLLDMNKRETIDQIKKCIINAKKIGLETKVLLQYGLPGETEEDWNDTLKFLKEAKPEHYTLSKFVPLSGS
jgi:radical SAM superfamily enzyme YgiQ (UPF0313 family)